jgi:predicted nucleic acid-binding protein
LGEIRKGIAGSAAPASRRAHLETWLVVDLPKGFAGRVLSVDASIADSWGIISHQLKRNGTPISTVDALLAATALHHNLVVVTRNVWDFEKTGVRSSIPGI